MNKKFVPGGALNKGKKTPQKGREQSRPPRRRRTKAGTTTTPPTHLLNPPTTHHPPAAANYSVEKQSSDLENK